MTWKLNTEQRDAAAAWTLTLDRVDDRDRTAHAINAISDLGNLPVVRCDAHHAAGSRLMTFSEAVAYLRAAPGEHHLIVDFDEVELV